MSATTFLTLWRFIDDKKREKKEHKWNKMKQNEFCYEFDERGVV